MASYDIQIEDQRFQGETASARDQFEALHIVAGTSMIIAVQQTEMSDKAASMSLLNMPWDSVQKIERLLVRDRVKREDDDVPVANNLFHDDPAGYALLITKVIRANLSDSFTRLRGDEKSAKPTQQQPA